MVVGLAGPPFGASGDRLLLLIELAVDHLGQCAGEGPELLTPVDAGEFVEEPGYDIRLCARQQGR